MFTPYYNITNFHLFLMFTLYHTLYPLAYNITNFVISSISAPLFIFQWVFDEAQMTADNVGKPISKEQWDYIHSIGERLRKTFENVT